MEAKCYLQENDPPEDHDIERFSCVCGKCYEALSRLEEAAQRSLCEAEDKIKELEKRLSDMHQAHANLLIDRALWRERYTQAMEQHGFTREFLGQAGENSNVGGTK